MNPGILGRPLREPCCCASDMCAVTVAVHVWRCKPIQRKALPYSAATAISRQKVLVRSIDTLQEHAARHHHSSARGCFA